MCVCACIGGKRERATMNKQYVALPDPTWERTNSGGLFRSVTSSMPGKFHFNLLIFGCLVGGWGGGGGYGTRMSVKSNDGGGGAIQRGQLLCYKYHCCLCFFGIVWRFRILTWEGSFSM